VTRKDPVRSIRFPGATLVTFQRAAKAEGVALNRWMIAAGEAYLAGSKERIARAKAEGEAEE
jgi:hypothetical protein